MLQGNTLFAGDSMTVGLPPFVKVNGAKKMEAAVGRSSAQLLSALQAPGMFEGAANMVVLIGANDIGGGQPSNTVRAIWALARGKGVRVFAMTVPPNKGWANFASNLQTIEDRRRALNAALLAAYRVGEADGLVDLSTLLADPSDPERLAAAYDSGDHLHPRKDAMGALLTSALGSSAVVTIPPTVPATEESFPWALAFTLVAVGVGGTILLARKDWTGAPLATRLLHRLQ